MSLIKNFKGDTLIEVLLSIAVAGMVTSSSYALANRSLEEGISASERTEANKLAEGQIEALKLRESVSQEAWSTNYSEVGYPLPQGYSNIPSDASFCLDTAAVSEYIEVGSTEQKNGAWLPQQNAGDPTVLSTDSASPDHYNTICFQHSKYYVDVTAQSNSLDGIGQVFLVTVRWNPPGGGPLDQSQLYYKMPPKSP